MKAYILIFSTLLFSLKIFSQVTKVYQTENGKATDNPKKAAFYYLSKKLNDSTFETNKYNMTDGIVFKGYFKDESLKIPNGSFSFYSTTSSVNINTGIRTVDTNRFVTITGFFSNGIKTGLWTTYLRRGAKIKSRNYKNNKLNGAYKEFDLNTGQIIDEGNFVDGKRDGIVNTYRLNDTKPEHTYIYKNDVFVREIFHNRAPKAPDGFDDYLKKAVKPFFDYLNSESVLVTIDINEKGKVDSIISYNQPVNKDAMQLVNKALLNSPPFEPGILNDVPIRQTYSYNFQFGSSYFKNYTPYQYSKEFLAKRNSEDIGNGINIGFWRPPQN